MRAHALPRSLSLSVLSAPARRIGLALALAFAAPAGAQERPSVFVSGPAPTGPALAAASNFGQGAGEAMMAAALALGVRDFRDAVYWRDTEAADGSVRFTGWRETFPDRLHEAGAVMSLTVNNAHPAHDGGETPISDAGRAAFAAHAARAVARFPAITGVEIGNEMNSGDFVSSAWRDVGLAERAALYAALLERTAQAVRAARPETRIIGGAAHSIPLGWLGPVLAQRPQMDALALHPYTTAPEQLARQVALLRQLPGAETLPIEATEFGSTDPSAAPHLLLRHYCQMALAGVSRAVWYPLNPRGDGLVPLIGPDLAPTGTGRAYALIAQHLEGRPAADAAPDPFTYGCRFGDAALVLWGAPRAVSLAPGLRAVDAAGAAAPLRLDPERPLLILGPGAESGVSLSPQTVLADSYHQFAYPGSGQPGPFTIEAILPDGRIRPLETRPGQERGGVPWTPYLALRQDAMARAGADWLLPSAWDAGPIPLRVRLAAPEGGASLLRLVANPAQRSEDGVIVKVTLNGRVIQEEQRAPGAVGEIALPLDLAAGDEIAATVAPGSTAKGDVTRFRLVLERR